MGRGSRSIVGSSGGSRELRELVARPSRPGQAPPIPNLSGIKRTAQEVERVERSRNHPAIQYKREKEVEAANWKKQRPSNVDKYTTSFPQLQQYQQDEQQWAKQCIVQRVAAALKRHSCCQATGNLDCLQHLRSRPVVCWGLGIRTAIDLATYKCAECGEEVVADAYAVGYAPSAPLYPNFWVQIKVLELFRHLQVVSGQSADGAQLS